MNVFFCLITLVLETNKIPLVINSKPKTMACAGVVGVGLYGCGTGCEVVDRVYGYMRMS